MDLLLPSDEAPVLWDAPTQRDSFVWRATHEAGALREFLADTLWGELDFLFLDLPPGTDRIPHVLGLLPEGTGALLVTIPSQVSQLAVRKSVTMARDVLRVPVVGLLENMGAYACSRCGARDHLFHDGGSETIARDMGIPFLGSVPFDPRISACGDRGVAFVLEHADSPAGKAFAEVAATLRAVPQSQGRDEK
jgi:ATP-binding protein involved in chromosome partitioning